MAFDDAAQPLVALLQQWRDRAFAQPHNSTLDALCDDLEAALAAQRQHLLKEANRHECRGAGSYDVGTANGLRLAAEMLKGER